MIEAGLNPVSGSIRDLTRQAISRVSSRDHAIGAFTSVLKARALADADRLDSGTASSREPGPLAGFTFAVKDLFDVGGKTTTAGAASRLGMPPAKSDAEVVARLRNAGAILLGTTNMDEFAYGFSTQNAHFGTTRNPHDLKRIAGGSSGGSAAAVAAGMVDFALGSDTNGSVRVPASLCGIYGLRPSHGSIPTEGMFPFVQSLDTPGPFAYSLDLLQRVWDAMSGTSPQSGGTLRVGRLDGWFRADCDPEALAAADEAGCVLGGAPVISFPMAEAARSAAFVLTAAEGGSRHLAELQADPMSFDPATRDRLLAGALIPSEAVHEARLVRERVKQRLPQIFARHDVLIAPATPCVAPPIGDSTISVGGRQVSARANLGLYTQPLSLTGLPVLSVPILRNGRLPLGLQLIAAHGRESDLFTAAALLEDAGVTGPSQPSGNLCS